MKNHEEFERLNAAFSNLAKKGAAIISRWGSVYNCPPEIAREFVMIGQQQQVVQKQIALLFEKNGGVIND